MSTSEEESNNQLAGLAPQVAELAVRAGHAILEIYGGDFEVETKADSSPLTQADLASQEIIVAGLAQLTPDLPVLAEETGELPFEERRSWRRSWLVDPLDGTREFVKRNGEFTVNIAMVEAGQPILGVVHAPVLGVTYLASRGGGARRLDASGERSIAVSPPPDNELHDGELHGGELRIVMSRSHANEATLRFIGRLEREYRVNAVSQGSALKMCLVADGTAHIYPRLGPTMEWDVAAAQCVVEEAGGQLVTLDGAPMGFNRPNLVNESFLACYGDAEKWLRLLGNTGNG
ncbi:MAG: 3'(2'),5'-bisphosphate nucleotidase CysQ [Trueperaceae bacterium]